MLAWLCLPLFVGASQDAASLEAVQQQLRSLSLSELMDMPITSVAKKPQARLDSPAALFVITQEDIRRGGFTSIPEALRIVPGIEVARISANKWAVTARGFNGLFANKLLVLVDGRSVYSPLFSGTYWDVQDTLLEDIERIEVIRGPGATLWGANAVNGIINIITKPAWETQGSLLVLGGGREEQGFGGFRYGGTLKERGHYRVYGRYFERDASANADGSAAADDWQMARLGFRVDWNWLGRDRLRAQGEWYGGEVGESSRRTFLSPPDNSVVADDSSVGGGHLLLRWERDQSHLQFYYDRTERKQAPLGEQRDTFDLEWQQRLSPSDNQEISWGLGFRYTHDQIRNSFTVRFSPDNASHRLFSAFIQDEIRWLDGRVRLSIGSKFEHNDFSDTEIQPSLRILWQVSDRQRLWAAVSRAVHTPDRSFRDISVNVAAFPNPQSDTVTLLTLRGDSGFDSEEILAYELGYRWIVGDSFSLDVATFYNEYQQLQSIETEAPVLVSQPIPHLNLVQHFANRAQGEAYGVELSADWKVTPDWRLSLGYSYFRLQLHTASRDMVAEQPEDESPQHQLKLRSWWNLPGRVSFDSALFYVDALDVSGVPSYVRLDLRLAWQATRNLELSLVAQDLLDDRHPEFNAFFQGFRSNEIERPIFGKLLWRF